MSAELLKSIKQQIAALPLSEKEQLAAFLDEQLQQAEKPSPDGAAHTDDEIRRRRLSWIKAHREEYAGQYVALHGDVLVGAVVLSARRMSKRRERASKIPSSCA